MWSMILLQIYLHFMTKSSPTPRSPSSVRGKICIQYSFIDARRKNYFFHSDAYKKYFTTSTIKHEASITLCHLLWRLFCRLAKRQPSGNSWHEKHSWENECNFCIEKQQINPGRSIFKGVDLNKWNRLLCLHEVRLSVLCAVFGLQFMEFSPMINIPCCGDGSLGIFCELF